MRSVILCLGGFLAVCSTWAEDSPLKLGEDAALEFSVKKEQSEDRIADFYTRLILLERNSKQREEGAEEMRRQRKVWAAEEAKARQEFKRERRSESEAGQVAYEKAMVERKKEYERIRRDYVRRRDEMSQLQKKAGGIPEDIEYGIQPQ